MKAVMVFLLVSSLGGQGAEAPSAAFLWQHLGIREPFLASREVREEPQSLNRFFGPQDYERLRGNPGLGFYAAGGFRWVGRRVRWEGVRPGAPGASGVPEEVWNRAFRALARRQGWIEDIRAPIRIKGACVGAVGVATAREPSPGVCLELQVGSPTGTLLFRFAIARPSVEEAAEAALDWVLRCAVALDQLEVQGGRHGAS